MSRGKLINVNAIAKSLLVIINWKFDFAQLGA